MNILLKNGTCFLREYLQEISQIKWYITFSVFTANLRVYFNEQGIVPRNKSFLVDQSPDTCSTFQLDNGTSIAQYSQVRFQVPATALDHINVTLVGTNLGCGHNLYVTPVSAAETKKWIGRWKTCRLFDIGMNDGKDNCSYRCGCLGNCEEIQVIKMPMRREESCWSICHISLTYTITGMIGPLIRLSTWIDMPTLWTKH